MAYTFKNPSTNLRLREQPTPEVSTKSENEPEKGQEGGISFENWRHFQKALYDALLPHSEARTAVAYAIRDLQLRLGIVV